MSVDKWAQTDLAIHDLIRRRWSPRAFGDRMPDAATLRRLFEAARWAPSAYNEQPTRFIIATKAQPMDYVRLLEVLVERNQDWARTAPILMLTVTRTTFTHNGKPNRHAWHDAGLALAHFILQATAEGLHVHPMAGFKPDVARERYAIPPEFEPVAAVAVGYLGPVEAIPEALRSMETAARTRRPIGVYAQHWESPADTILNA